MNTKYSIKFSKYYKQEHYMQLELKENTTYFRAHFRIYILLLYWSTEKVMGEKKRNRMAIFSSPLSIL